MKTMNRCRTGAVGALLLALSFAIPAEESRNYTGFSGPHLGEERRQQPGGDTRALLEFQRSGAEASPHSQALPSGVRSRIYLRYLESFEHPIPSQFFSPDQRAAR